LQRVRARHYGEVSVADGTFRAVVPAAFIETRSLDMTANPGRRTRA